MKENVTQAITLLAFSLIEPHMYDERILMSRISKMLFNLSTMQATSHESEIGLLNIRIQTNIFM